MLTVQQFLPDWPMYLFLNCFIIQGSGLKGIYYLKMHSQLPHPSSNLQLCLKVTLNITFQLSDLRRRVFRRGRYIITFPCQHVVLGCALVRWGWEKWKIVRLQSVSTPLCRTQSFQFPYWIPKGVFEHFKRNLDKEKFCLFAEFFRLVRKIMKRLIQNRSFDKLSYLISRWRWWYPDIHPILHWWEATAASNFCSVWPVHSKI